MLKLDTITKSVRVFKILKLVDTITKSVRVFEMLKLDTITKSVQVFKMLRSDTQIIIVSNFDILKTLIFLVHAGLFWKKRKTKISPDELLGCGFDFHFSQQDWA